MTVPPRSEDASAAAEAECPRPAPAAADGRASGRAREARAAAARALQAPLRLVRRARDPARRRRGDDALPHARPDVQPRRVDRRDRAPRARRAVAARAAQRAPVGPHHRGVRGAAEDRRPRRLPALHGAADRAAARARRPAVRHREGARRGRHRARRRHGRAALRPRIRELPHPRPGRADGLDRRRRGRVPHPRPPAVQARRPHPLRPAHRRAVRVGARDPDHRRRRARAAAHEGRARAAVGRRRAAGPLPPLVPLLRHEPRGLRRARDQRAVGVGRDEPRRRRAHRRAPDRARPRLPHPAARRARLQDVPRPGGVAHPPRRDRDRRC